MGKTTLETSHNGCDSEAEWYDDHQTVICRSLQEETEHVSPFGENE